MVLQALTRARGDDSAALRNHRITSFFTPLSSRLPINTEAVISSDSRLNSLKGSNLSQEDDRSSMSPSPPPEESTSKTPKRLKITHNRGMRNGATHIEDEDATSQASSARPDTRQTRRSSGVKSSKDTRTLRSKEKSHFKSELALYFANYDDIITDAPRPPDFLKLDEAIYIVDEPVKRGSTANSPAKSRAGGLPTRARAASIAQATAGASQTPETPTQEAKTIHIVSPSVIDANKDPLGDEVYYLYHRRAERKEKQLRNIEKEKAQHEKVQLERILDGLQGPDWLKVLGVSGVTESEQKEWKPKRDYFIREVSDLVAKFRLWRDTERRLRMRKEREREEAELDDDDSASDTSSQSSSSDMDAHAAMQLLQEAGLTPKPPRRRKNQYVLYEAPPSPELPFTGFYKEPHLRAQALDDTRERRHITAFGQPLPEVPEEEFELWPDLTSHDTRRARDRKRRKIKQEPEAELRRISPERKA